MTHVPAVASAAGKRHLGRMRSFTMLLAASLIFLFGCATRDWNSRIGSYTFDDAVREFGPPDQTKTLDDGTMVAEWLQVRGGYDYLPRPVHTMAGRTYYSYHPMDSTVIPRPANMLRLTFLPTGALAEKQNVARWPHR